MTAFKPDVRPLKATYREWIGLVVIALPCIVYAMDRRSKSIETLLPILYLKGISTGDFSEALAALLGKDAAGLSASAD
jgi:hypothetical protein